MITDDDIRACYHQLLFSNSELSVSEQNLMRDCQIALAMPGTKAFYPEARELARARVERSIKLREVPAPAPRETLYQEEFTALLLLVEQQIKSSDPTDVLAMGALGYIHAKLERLRAVAPSLTLELTDLMKEI